VGGVGLALDFELHRWWRRILSSHAPPCGSKSVAIPPWKRIRALRLHFAIRSQRRLKSFGNRASNAKAAMVPPSLFAYLIVSTLAIQLGNAQSPAPTSSAPKSTVLTQHVLHPAHKDILVPGSISTIRWEVNSHFTNVTLQLWDNTSWGYSRDLLSPCIPWGRNPFCGTIATHVPNTGSLDWYIPNPANGSLGYGFPRDEQVYWVKIFVEDYLHDEIGNRRPVVSWSQNFAFAADGESGSVVDDEPSTTNSEGVPVYVTDRQSATMGSSAASTVTSTSVSAKTTATTSLPKGGSVAPPTQGEASTLKGSMWLSGALSLVLGFI
jgi:hypothetical protein